MSKPKPQARMKSLTFDEKIKILERLRDRSKAIAAAGLRRESAPKNARKQQTQQEQE